MEIMGPRDYARMGGMGRRGIGGLRGQFNRSRAMGRPAYPTPPPGQLYNLPSRPMGGMMNPMATPGVFKPMGDEIDPSAQRYPMGMPQPGYTPPAAGRWEGTGGPGLSVPTGPPRQGFMRGPTESARQSIYNQGPAPISDDTFGPVGRLPGYATPMSPPPPPQQFSAGPQVSLLAPQGPAPFQNISRPLGQPQPLGGPGQQMLGGPQQQGGGQAQGGAKWTMEIKPSEGGMYSGGIVSLAEGGVVPGYFLGKLIKKVGKAAAKLAPIAVGFIPGVSGLSAPLQGLIGGAAKGVSDLARSDFDFDALDVDSILQHGMGSAFMAKASQDPEWAARNAAKIKAMEDISSGMAGGQGTDITAGRMMPGAGSPGASGARGGAGDAGTITEVEQSTAQKYGLFDQLTGKAGGGQVGNLYAMRRFGGGPIKGYQEGGEFGDEFDEPMYRPPPRRRARPRRRPSRAQQEAARRREAEMRRQRERAEAERAEEARMAEDIEPTLPATIAAMPPPPPPPAPVEAPPENIEPVAPPRIVAPPPPPPPPPPVMEDEPMEEDMAPPPPPRPAPVAPPPPPPPPPMPPPAMEDDIEVEDEFARPDVPVGTPPLGTLDDQFIDEVEQVLPTTTRSIPATDVSNVMLEPGEEGEGEEMQDVMTSAEGSAAAAEAAAQRLQDQANAEAARREVENPYGEIPAEVLSGEREMTQAEIDKRAGNMEKEMERQVEQAQTEAKKELIATNQLDPDDKGEQVEEMGEPDEQEVYKQDDPLGVQATIDSGVTPSGIVDVNTGEVKRNEEYINERTAPPQAPAAPPPPPETFGPPPVMPPAPEYGGGLFGAPTEQSPMNMFGVGASPFAMPTESAQFEDPRMKAMLERMDAPEAPLQSYVPKPEPKKEKEDTKAKGKAEGGLIEELVNDETGMMVIERVAQALQSPDDPESQGVIEEFSEAFGPEALQELMAYMQGGAQQAPTAPMQSGGMIPGNGDAMADDIRLVADAGTPDAQPIDISSGEFVIAGDVVSHLGSGNTDRGAEVLEQLQEDVRVNRTGTPDQAPPIQLDEVLPATYGERYG